jgi:hypothetical protein
MTPPGTSNLGGGEPVTGATNHVEINLTIAQASESEARKFAQLVKSYLDDDALTTNMGRM